MSRKELFLIFQLQPSKAHIQFRFLTCANRLLVERGEAKLDEPAGITTQVMAAPDRDVSGVFFLVSRSGLNAIEGHERPTPSPSSTYVFHDVHIQRPHGDIGHKVSFCKARSIPAHYFIKRR